MPRVRVLTAISGVDGSYVRGDLVDLSEGAAASWCAAGMAELAETPEIPELVVGETPEDAAAVETPERAPATEKAARTSRTSRGRK